MLGRTLCFIGRIALNGIGHVLVDTDGAFRFLLIPVYVLCENEAQVTFCLGDASPSRAHYAVVVVDVVASVGRKVDRFQGSFPIRQCNRAKCVL